MPDSGIIPQKLDTGEFDAHFAKRMNRGMWGILTVGLGMLASLCVGGYYISRLPTAADNEKQVAAYAPSRKDFAEMRVKVAQLEGKIESVNERYSRFESRISADLKEIKADIKDIAQQFSNLDPAPRRRRKRE